MATDPASHATDTPVDGSVRTADGNQPCPVVLATTGPTLNDPHTVISPGTDIVVVSLGAITAIEADGA